MNFCPDKLTEVRTSLNISKAEAARRLNMTAMAYGRYEKGEREPSYQTVCYIAYVFNCNIDFLYGKSDKMSSDYIIVSQNDTDLYQLVKFLKNDSDGNLNRRLLEYYLKLAGK
ncbi:helix-turn-helix domain-containing protein [uncultured Eubacterium sp.]|uniref:helix-turn-helix domain-containing protein n=1 Tax=uncultured Eubacterium sp. TaxID=165185 RepID=UPI002594E063|nr:helix-turn-helix transcriptional regulator [uncultured Eubacterium sp.]